MEETRNVPYYSGEDRISRLPDELIHYIMSFILTRYAVQTSVLSKRWISIWKSLPYLNIERKSFPLGKEHDQRFIHFVDMVFILRDDIDIQSCLLRWYPSEYDDIVTRSVNRWIVHAVRRNVQDLTIKMCKDCPSAYEIPPLLLNCKSLKKLLMQVYGMNGAKYADIILPRSLNLPQLKVLSLVGLSISDVESSKRLFSSCPILKTLNLVDCGIQTDGQRNLVVDSPKLKKFEYSHRSRHRSRENMASTIKLCAPNLEVFICKSFLTQDLYLENCSPVRRVHFHMKRKLEEEDENAETYSLLPLTEKDIYAKRMHKFLGSVYMTKEITLSPGFLEVLSQPPDLPDCQPPRLWNLEYLKLDMWPTRGCLRSIIYLLKISPHITRLLLKYKESNLADDGDGCEAELSFPGMLPHLKFVKLETVGGYDAELKLLSFLLKHANVLEEVVLIFSSGVGSPDRVKQFRDKLRALPSASSNIKMRLFEP